MPHQLCGKNILFPKNINKNFFHSVFKGGKYGKIWNFDKLKLSCQNITRLSTNCLNLFNRFLEGTFYVEA